MLNNERYRVVIEDAFLFAGLSKLSKGKRNVCRPHRTLQELV
jgi:hypothetical protein